MVVVGANKCYFSGDTAIENVGTYVQEYERSTLSRFITTKSKGFAKPESPPDLTPMMVDLPAPPMSVDVRAEEESPPDLTPMMVDLPAPPMSVDVRAEEESPPDLTPMMVDIPAPPMSVDVRAEEVEEVQVKEDIKDTDADVSNVFEQLWQSSEADYEPLFKLGPYTISNNSFHCLKTTLPDEVQLPREVLGKIFKEVVLADGDNAYLRLSLVCCDFYTICSSKPFQSDCHLSWLLSIRPKSYWEKNENKTYFKSFQVHSCATCQEVYKDEGAGFVGGKGRVGEFQGFMTLQVTLVSAVYYVPEWLALNVRCYCTRVVTK